MNVVAVEPRTHNIILKKAYDTYGNNNASKNMLKDLNDLPDGSVIIVGVKDEASRKLGKKLKKYFQKMGSKEIGNLGFR